MSGKPQLAGQTVVVIGERLGRFFDELPTPIDKRP
jgi:hypothetical protein